VTGNRLGAHVSRLVRDRAYAGGELRSLQRRAKDLKSELQAVEERILEASRLITELDEAIASRSCIETALIRPIRLTPRRIGSRHGTFNATLVAFLRDAGRPVLTSEVLQHMTEAFHLPTATAVERESTRRRIVRPMRNLVAKGVLERLHDVDGNTEGCWVWARSQDTG
jgi:hypothetical protein